MKVKKYIVWCPDLDDTGDPNKPGDSAKEIKAEDHEDAASQYGTSSYWSERFDEMNVYVRRAKTGQTWSVCVEAEVDVSFHVMTESEVERATPEPKGEGENG